ncbi:MAG: DUF4350 domain-containing protein, partial [Candidatus Thorarchaeota archaeon]
AIYDEDNLTSPAFSDAVNLTNNLAEITSILEDAGHSVEALTEADILSHELITADYDVFIIINNIPRPSIINHVKEFWMGGGGILSFNSALSYLLYAGILDPTLTDDGYISHWLYHSSDTQNVSARHPTMKDYHINDTISERAENWVITSTLVLDNFNTFSDPVALMTNVTLPAWVTAFAVDRSDYGGRIVHLPGDGSSIPTEFESIISDSVEWLIPRPKGRIAFDLSHWPRISVDPWDVEFATTFIEPNVFTQFRTLAVNHSYTFDKLYPSSTGNLTAERLANYDVLIIDWPDVNYTDAEYLAVEEWVDGGGSLLVLGDRTGLGGDGYIYINTMLQNFDMSLGTTNVLDYTTSTPGTHVTLEGCTSLSIAYRNYLSVIGSADTIWLESGNPVVASQDFGQGRAILVGDMNIFDDGQLQLTDNRRFALNVLNWLTANDAEILVHTDYLGWRDAPCLALNDLGLPYQLFTTRDYLDDFLDSKEWSLLIYNAVNYLQELTILDELYAYVDNGGKLIMTYFAVDDDPTHPLWSKVGVEFSSTLSGNPSMYVWDASHPIFSEPNDHGVYNYTSNGPFADDGDAVTVRSGYTALAGTTGNIQDGSAAIVVSSDRQTLFNAFVIDNFGTDEDDSTYADSIELWENEITFMMPSGGGGFQFPLDATTLAIIGAAVGGIIIIGVVASRQRSGSSTPKSKPKKKSTKKK